MICVALCRLHAIIVWHAICTSRTCHIDREMQLNYTMQDEVDLQLGLFGAFCNLESDRFTCSDHYSAVLENS